MTENQQEPTQLEKSQERTATWVVAIFAALGVVFLIFFVYTFVFIQKGQGTLANWVLLPVPILMLLSCLGWFSPNTAQPPRSRVLDSLSGSGSPPANHDGPGGIK